MMSTLLPSSFLAARLARSSTAIDASYVVERELLGAGAAAPGSHNVGVAPGPQHPGTGLVQHHHERVGVRIHIELV